ncbi:hypothetical protein EDC96DRAFT_522336 [Choanephora cucurbitarum]|nr:hypothetical protein EDC96DRAFT_522336 [Choanephora cucurbitarum]
MSSFLETIKSAFELEDMAFEAIVNGFKAEYNTGLETASASGLATMIPSYVTTLPTGKETGTYLSLDLGGSTLRVCAVELLGNCNTKVTEIRRHIAPNDPLRTSGATAFFDWIVDTVTELLQRIGHDTVYAEGPLSMGVCWSFPIDQTSISDGKILRMGKGFTIEGIEGYDLAGLFEQSFKRRNVNVKVMALLNDTVGTLVAHAYSNPDVRVGFIYGTGVNAAYPEKVRRIIKLQDQQQIYTADTTMLVNTEIDIFGNDTYLPRNKYDKQLDKNHSQPNFQLYEKMMSGACIGELVRLSALDLIGEGHLFEGHQPLEFDKAMEFGTAVTSDIESHLDNEPKARLDHFKGLFSFKDDYLVSQKDLDIFSELCVIVSDRAARLAAAAMASLIEQQPELINEAGPIVIGVNGSTYEKYTKMHDRICTSLTRWFGAEVGRRIKVEVATDGGSIGGALIAMLAEKEEKRRLRSTYQTDQSYGIAIHNTKKQPLDLSSEPLNREVAG